MQAAAPHTKLYEKVIQPPGFSVVRIGRGLRDLWQYKDLLITLTVHRIKVRYKQSALGLLWAILQPLLLMAVYTVIFSRIAKMPSDGAPYAVFVYAALLPWTFFATSITTATGCLVAHTNLITKVYFPREILPLTYVFAAFFDFLMAALVLGVLLFLYRVPVNRNAFFAIPVMLIGGIFTLALALAFSAFQVRFRDVGIAIALLLQLWMYATPVVYPLSVIPQRYRWLLLMNPMSGVVENFRRVVIQGVPVDLSSLWPAAAISIVLLPLAYLYFKTAEATMADII